MKINFSGDAEFETAINALGNFIGDPGKISSCIPDSRDFVKEDDIKFSIVTEMSLGAIKGELRMHCTIEKVDNSRYVYIIEGRGLGSSVKVRLTLNLQDKGNSSVHMSWESLVELTGIIGSIGEPAVRHTAQEYVEKIITNLSSGVKASMKQ